MEPDLRRITHFLFEVGMLKKTPRSGYKFLGSGGESVADHSFRTAVIGYVLSHIAGIEPYKVTLMCLFHDLPETRTGDQNYMNKKYVTADENQALLDQVKYLHFGGEIKALIEEFQEGKSKEAMLAKDADQLDLMLELKVQLDLGNRQAKDWLLFAQKRLKTKEACLLADTILNMEWTEWWFDKDSLWWVNGPEEQK